MQPLRHHIIADKRIIHNLIGSPTRGLFSPTHFDLHLTAYSDVDWLTAQILENLRLDGVYFLEMP